MRLRRPFVLVAGLAVLSFVGVVVPMLPARALPPDCGEVLETVSEVTVTCSYTGAAQGWTVPPGVTQATFDVQGAQGGESGSAGGLGGRAVANLNVTPGALLTIVVGGAGGLPGGGFNGGADGGTVCPSVCFSGGGGGGASDVRLGEATALANRVIVAGGGGGGGLAGGANGGSGGGLTGGDGSNNGAGIGGNQDGSTGSGMLGVGSTSANAGGGGGGGYYGGSGSSGASGGGGGSGLTPDGTGMTNGVRAGAGRVTITYAKPPAAATLTSPSGAGVNNPVVLRWPAAPRSSWYYLWINKDGSTNVFKKWYRASDIGCSGGGTCAVFSPMTFPAGNYRWWVQTWNSGGSGPWSSSLDFTVPLPGKVSLLAPSGSGHSNPVSYAWVADPNATWYYLWINKNGTTNVFKQWFKATDISANCGAATGSCAISPSLTLAAGSYTWWVQSWSPAGYGPWSNSLTFGVS